MCHPTDAQRHDGVTIRQRVADTPCEGHWCDGWDRREMPRPIGANDARLRTSRLGSRRRGPCVLEYGTARERRTENSEGTTWPDAEMKAIRYVRYVS
jgi:hypothetical protein